MKTITSFIASSLLAFTLVTAHGAVNTIDPSHVVNIPNATAPTKAEAIAFEKKLQETQSQPVIVVLHENNDGAKIAVPNGTLVKVILASNAGSTGCDWTQTFSSPDILEFQNKKTKQKPFHLIGAPAQECWTFIATASGQTTLTFSLARSWKKRVLPQEEVQFDITVE